MQIKENETRSITYIWQWETTNSEILGGGQWETDNELNLLTVYLLKY